MGIQINNYRSGERYPTHESVLDDFEVDASGHLVPHDGETFEYMPMNCLSTYSYYYADEDFKENPHANEKMRWEIGFSDKRVLFSSPDSLTTLGGVAERPDQATLGFYYYSELHSLSLASAREYEGPYISTVFIIRVAPQTLLPVGIRVHGSSEYLHIFATMLVARLAKHYEELSRILELDLRELTGFFEEVNSYDYLVGDQIDFFISADENILHVVRHRADSQLTGIE